ncbi:MAG TPA: hypothetical protein VK041_05095 [Opitutales bacterium]|nr:hypothetical protein [Opitutales bacterium]
MKSGENEKHEKGDFVCDRCGRPAAIEADDVKLCSECYQLVGSCCMEFGGEDLWDDVVNEETSKEASEKAQRKVG